MYYTFLDKKNLVPSQHFTHKIWKSYTFSQQKTTFLGVFRVKLWDCKVPWPPTHLVVQATLRLSKRDRSTAFTWSSIIYYVPIPRNMFNNTNDKYAYIYIHINLHIYKLDMVYKCLRWLQLIDSRYANTRSQKKIPLLIIFYRLFFKGQQVHQDVIIHLSHTLKEQTCTCSCNLPMLIQYVW